MEIEALKKIVPPKPLESYYVQEGEVDGYGKPLVAGQERYNGFWPGFGWTGACVDRALATDSVAGIRWCIEHEIVNAETKTLYNTPLRRFAEERGAKLVAAHLEKIGYPA